MAEVKPTQYGLQLHPYDIPQQVTIRKTTQLVIVETVVQGPNRPTLLFTLFVNHSKTKVIPLNSLSFKFFCFIPYHRRKVCSPFRELHYLFFYVKCGQRNTEIRIPK